MLSTRPIWKMTLLYCWFQCGLCYKWRIHGFLFFFFFNKIKWEIYNFLIQNFRFPFNWHNPIGFLWAALIQYLMFVYIFFFIACSSTLAIAVYLFTTTATNDIQEKLHSVNETVERADEQSDISFEITNYIEYHSILKQLSIDWIKINFEIDWKFVHMSSDPSLMFLS